jgi:hypothetical protein
MFFGEVAVDRLELQPIFTDAKRILFPLCQ